MNGKYIIMEPEAHLKLMLSLNSVYDALDAAYGKGSKSFERETKRCVMKIMGELACNVIPAEWWAE